MSKRSKRLASAKPVTNTPDTSAYVYQDPKLRHPLNITCRYTLTPRQSVIVDTARDKQCKVVMIDGYWGTGKAQPLDAKVLTPAGWQPMGALKVGDEVIAGDGTTTTVVGVYPQGEKEVYRVTFSDGASTECCLDHLWLTQTEAERNRIRRKRNGGIPIYRSDPKPPSVRSLKDVRDTLLVSKDHLNHSIPMVAPVQFARRSHLIDPYVLGALLGDGGLTHGVGLTTADTELADRVSSLIPNSVRLKQKANDPIQYSILGAGQRGEANPFKDELTRLGLFGRDSSTKFVPDEYLIDSVDNRIELLRGLMDTDGSVSKHHVSYTTISPSLREGVCFLVQSLGGAATYTSRIPTFTYQGVRKEGQRAYTISVKLPNTINPFHLSRKRDAVIPRTKYLPIRYVQSVEVVGTKPTQCIAVAHVSHLYVTDDCIVTHNTMLATLASLQLMSDKRLSGLVYLRNPLEATNTAKVGTLPGSLEERMESYNSILYDKLGELLPKADVDLLKKEGRIECIPVGLIQGKTFTCKAVIVDEAASLSWDDLMLVISRMGEHSKLFVIGDSTFQLAIGAKSGFKRFFDTFRDDDSKEHGVFCFELKEKEDIRRSGLLRFVMEKTGVIPPTVGRIDEPMFAS